MKIGPCFASELVTAGLSGLPIGWTADGVIGLEALSDKDSAAVQAVLDAHDPSRPLPRTLDKKAWNEALAAAGKLSAWLALVNDMSVAAKDRAYLMSGGANGDYLESNVKLARLARKAGADVKAIFDAASSALSG